MLELSTQGLSVGSIQLRGASPEIANERLGGQITGSGALFLTTVEEACQKRGVHFYVTQDTSLCTLLGLTRL